MQLKKRLAFKTPSAAANSGALRSTTAHNRIRFYCFKLLVHHDQWMVAVALVKRNARPNWFRATAAARWFGALAAVRAIQQAQHGPAGVLMWHPVPRAGPATGLAGISLQGFISSTQPSSCDSQHGAGQKTEKGVPQVRELSLTRMIELLALALRPCSACSRGSMRHISKPSACSIKGALEWRRSSLKALPWLRMQRSVQQQSCPA